MQISIYSEVTGSLKELPEEEFFEALNGMCPEVFIPILETFKGYAVNVVKFIVDGYSVDSKKFLIKSNWTVRKKQLAKDNDIPDSSYGAIADLESPVVRAVIASYLEYQGDFDFKHLRMLQHLYENMMNVGFTGEFDMEKALKNREQLSELRSEINEIQKELMEKYHVYYENIGAVKDDKPTVPLTLTNIASSPNVRK